MSLSDKKTEESFGTLLLYLIDVSLKIQKLCSDKSMSNMRFDIKSPKHVRKCITVVMDYFKRYEKLVYLTFFLNKNINICITDNDTIVGITLYKGDYGLIFSCSEMGLTVSRLNLGKLYHQVTRSLCPGYFNTIKREKERLKRFKPTEVPKLRKTVETYVNQKCRSIPNLYNRFSKLVSEHKT